MSIEKIEPVDYRVYAELVNAIITAHNKGCDPDNTISTINTALRDCVAVSGRTKRFEGFTVTLKYGEIEFNTIVRNNTGLAVSSTQLIQSIVSATKCEYYSIHGNHNTSTFYGYRQGGTFTIMPSNPNILNVRYGKEYLLRLRKEADHLVILYMEHEEEKVVEAIKFVKSVCGVSLKLADNCTYPPKFCEIFDANRTFYQAWRPQYFD